MKTALLDRYMEDASELLGLMGGLIAEGKRGEAKFDFEFLDRFKILAGQFAERRSAIEALRGKGPEWLT